MSLINDRMRLCNAFNRRANWQDKISAMKDLIALYDELVSLEHNKGVEDLIASQILLLIYELTAPMPDIDAIRKKAMESIGKPIQVPKP